MMNTNMLRDVERLGTSWALAIVAVALVWFANLPQSPQGGAVNAAPVKQEAAIMQADETEADAPVMPDAAAPPAPTPVKVGGKIAADKACYVRLPDLPHVRTGMFGAINPQTGVLVAAGGGEKIGKTNLTYYQLFALKLSSTLSRWQEVPFGATEGYTREPKKGCKDMVSVQVSDGLALSVLGKGGCDHGRFDKVNRSGTDIQAINIGATADPLGVSWVPNSGIAGFVDQLTTNGGALAGHFATWDTHRSRLIFGQGAFNGTRETMVEDEVYAGTMLGSVVKLQKLEPAGAAPERRTGSCGAYVYNEATGVDGVIVLGGKEGGPVGTPLRDFNEVWWLDFSKTYDGEWKNITSRFANMKAIGLRNGGVCSYDPASKSFFSLMGKTSASLVPGGNSAGLWRVNLAELGNSEASFTWEPLAKDNLSGLKGRSGIPTIWDPVARRFFVIGGNQGGANNGLVDTWAIYPDITGAECLALNPFTAGPDQPTGLERAEPDPNAPKACRQIATRVDAGLVAAALANPAVVPGWMAPADPSKPIGPDNPAKTWLSLQDPFARYHSVFNTFVFRAGCP